jgi:hypothetical protein
MGGYNGQELYSVRRHSNGSFQVWHDNYYEGCKQSDQDGLPLTGFYADTESAEAELLRLGLITPSTKPCVISS